MENEMKGSDDTPEICEGVASNSASCKTPNVNPIDTIHKKRLTAFICLLISLLLLFLGLFAFFSLKNVGDSAFAGLIAPRQIESNQSAANENGDGNAAYQLTSNGNSANNQSGKNSSQNNDEANGDLDGQAAGASVANTDTGSMNPSDSEGSASGSTSESNSGNQNAESSPSRSDYIRVVVSVDSSAVGNPVSGGVTATFPKGANAYDALMACGLDVKASNSFSGVYVSSIGGLAEKQHGTMSGWMFKVNGELARTSASNVKLKDGDTVSWFYTT